MTDKTDLIREIHEYVTAHGGENTATHLLVQAASAIQTQAAELEAIGAGGVSGPLMGIASLSANAGEPVAWQYRSLLDVGGVWFECSKERAEQRAAHPDRWEVRPLYAAPPAAQAEGWRPISTAPKDGALIVLGARNGVWLGKYVPVYQSGYRPENPWSSMLLNHDHMAERYTRPTHWMPLPPPPTSADGVEHG